jgi:hypothetical protein
MSRSCAVCSHPQRRLIERALALADQSPRSVAECVGGLSRQQIKRHWRECPLIPDVRKTLFRRLEADARRGTEEVAS